MYDLRVTLEEFRPERVEVFGRGEDAVFASLPALEEHLAGLYLVDCDSEQRAVEIAAQVPDAVWGLVEVRPVLDRRAFDI